MADNLNSAYLGQPGASDNLNLPFLPETASEATLNARSDFSTRGELHSQGDAVVGGTLTVTGVITNAAKTLLPNGTEADPAIGFSSEASLGFYRSGASTIAMTGITQLLVADGSEAVPGLGFESEASLGFRRSAASVVLMENGELTIADGGLNVSSVITSTDGGGDFGSIATAANDTGMPDGAFRFVNTASGISLAYRSGGTTYYLGAGSTESEA
ncbi:hypothetical protein LCGC14_2965440 [marine sediment metagenome]|uniref:Uncharacterized protein n=1 Tax=marine sediment metagenome TaxID=412755 RepID=A0A0F8XYE2_9ZZZZ